MIKERKLKKQRKRKTNFGKQYQNEITSLISPLTNPNNILNSHIKSKKERRQRKRTKWLSMKGGGDKGTE